MHIFRLFDTVSDDVFKDVARISYTALLNDDSKVDSQILSSMKEYGFFYVVDIPGYDAKLEQGLMETFFNLPEDIKASVEIRRHNPENKNAYRGYFNQSPWRLLTGYNIWGEAEFDITGNNRLSRVFITGGKVYNTYLFYHCVRKNYFK